MVSTFFFSGCFNPDQKFTGTWTVHKGSCRDQGEIVIEIYDKRVDVDFLCFIVTCARARGKVDQSGHFHFNLPKNQNFDGLISGNQVRGTWNLMLENDENCGGTYQASRFRSP